jgi:hypothetical protein
MYTANQVLNWHQAKVLRRPLNLGISTYVNAGRSLLIVIKRKARRAYSRHFVSHSVKLREHILSYDG